MAAFHIGDADATKEEHELQDLEHPDAYDRISMHTSEFHSFGDANAHSADFGLSATTIISANRIHVLHQRSSEYVKEEIEILRDAM